jgi:hypothetical protein
MGRYLGALQRLSVFRKTALIAFVFISSGIPFLCPTPLHAQSNAPTLTVDDTRANTVTIAWSGVDTATHFELWRWSVKGAAWSLLHNGISGSSYIDNGVDAGQSYHYAVRAQISTGRVSSWSDYTSWNAIASVGSLDAPTLTIDDTRAFQVHLQWTEVDGAAGYELWRWHTGDNEWFQLDIDPTATQHTDTAVTAGVTYIYTVRATAEDWPHGAWSNFRLEEAAATVKSSDSPPLTDGSTPTSTLTMTPTATPSSTPTSTPTPRPTSTPTPRPKMRPVGNLRVAATTTTSITLAWDPPSGPIPATSYLIVWSPVADGVAGRNAHATAASYTFSGLVSNTQYFFYVWSQSRVHRARGSMSFIYASTQ